MLLPVFEELLFRGFLWDRLERAFGGGSAALWLSAALFGLWHVGYADTILCRMAWTGREGNLIAILAGCAGNSETVFRGCWPTSSSTPWDKGESE